jgi:hypothetical protein
MFMFSTDLDQLPSFTKSSSDITKGPLLFQQWKGLPLDRSNDGLIESTAPNPKGLGLVTKYKSVD